MGGGKTLMKLSRASGYAVQALVAMADGSGSAGHQDLVTAQLTARSQGIPEKFLAKVLKPLVSAGILVSLKGPHGGYRLAMKPTQITLLEIVEVVDGPIRGDAPSAPGKSPDALDRHLTAVCQKIADDTRRLLGKVRVSDLVSAKGNGKK
jgi:Rrf2 family protein